MCDEKSFIVYRCKNLDVHEFRVMVGNEVGKTRDELESLGEKQLETKALEVDDVAEMVL